MTVPTMTRLGSPASRRRPGPAALCAGALLLLSGLVAAQDNDDTGVLPYTGTAGGSGGSSAASAASAGAVVGVSTTIEAAEVDPTVARVRVSMADGQLATIAEGVPADQATLVALPGTAVAEQVAGSVLLQGEGELVASQAQPMTFEHAEQALLRRTFLVLDDGHVGLGELLAGKAQLLHVEAVGAADDVSVQGLASLVESHASELAGLRVTLAYVSLDASGLIHVSALGVTVDSGVLEIVTR